MNILSISDIQHKAGRHYQLQAVYGYISGISDNDFLPYILRFRHIPVVRRVFFSQIEKRPTLPIAAVDNAANLLLDAIKNNRKGRAYNEALLQHLIPKMSPQMRARTARFALLEGTKPIRKYVLRHVSPTDIPDVRDFILELAIRDKDQDALMGIVYHWPSDLWFGHLDEVFEATREWPWLQRQLIIKTNQAKRFLEKKAIIDPVTELYIRAKYGYPCGQKLITTAIEAVKHENFQNRETSQRIELLAWCLGRTGQLNKIKNLPVTDLSQVSYFEEVR